MTYHVDVLVVVVAIDGNTARGMSIARAAAADDKIVDGIVVLLLHVRTSVKYDVVTWKIREDNYSSFSRNQDNYS